MTNKYKLRECIGYLVSMAAIQDEETARAYADKIDTLLEAEMLNLSEQTVSKMVRDRRIKLNDCGMIPITEIDRVLSA